MNTQLNGEASRLRSFLDRLALIFCVAAAYVPFLGYRFVRTAGDEKVYISQALEMARDGHWFIQTLQDVPDYYKGPLHYLLLRLGFLFFHHSAWALFYMNLVLVILGALSLAEIVRRNLPYWRGGAFWSGLAFALSAGIYAHMFASQMEVELASLFAIGFYFLEKTSREASGFRFWAIAGVIGWVKSPLHSVFIGVSAVLFWILSGEIFAKLKNSKAWLAVIMGVFICTLGLLPAYFGDRENFWNFYILRETLAKASSLQPWYVSVVSTYGFYLFPWILVGLIAYGQFIFQIPKLFSNPTTRRLILLAFSGCLPSTAFFIWHDYHFENYNLPVFSAVILFIATLWSQATPFWRFFYRSGFALLSLLLILFPVLLSLIAFRFSPLPDWWPAYLIPIVWAATLFTAFGFMRWGALEPHPQPGWVAFSALGLFLAIGCVGTVLGEREMRDLRQYLASHPTSQPLYYYNLQHNIWSEWGILNFWIDHPVIGVHDPEKLKNLIEEGQVILVPPRDPHEDFKRFLETELPHLRVTETPWRRWRTHGESSSGQPLWLEAWQERDPSRLEINYSIFRATPHNP